MSTEYGKATAEEFEEKMRLAKQNGIYIQAGDLGGWMVKCPVSNACQAPLAAFSTLCEALEFIEGRYREPDEDEAENFDRPATLQDIRDLVEADGAVVARAGDDCLDQFPSI